MTPTSRAHTSPLGQDATADEIEADIERTRNDLGDTIDALSHKFDVPGRARDKVQDGKHRVTEHARATRERTSVLIAHIKDGATDDQVNPSAAVRLGAALAVAGIAAAIVVWLRRR